MSTPESKGASKETASERAAARKARRARRSTSGDQPVLVERRAEFYAAGIVAVIAFFVYLRTLSPGLHFGDGPEFATAAHVLGVPHPTGYPVYMILLKLWLVVTAAGEVVVRTTLFNAACLAASAGVATLILLDLLRTAFADWEDKSRLIAAASGALAGAFLRFHWANAVVTEVYALQFLLTLGFLRAVQLFIRQPGPRPLVMAAMFLGLALANHRMSLFLILPLSIVWAWAARRKVLPSLIRPALLSGVVMAAGIALYAYLPIRAATEPPINWGDPSTLSRFVKHIRGGEFVEQRFLRPVATDPTRRFTMESYTRFAMLEAGQILTDLARQIVPLRLVPSDDYSLGRVFYGTTIPGALLALIVLGGALAGGWRLWQSAPLFVGIAAVLAAQNVALLFLYNIADIADYYLFPFWLAWACLFVGGLSLTRLLPGTTDVVGGPTGQTAMPWAPYLLFVIPVLIGAANWAHVDRSADSGAETMAALLLPEDKEAMPEGSVLLTAGDHDIFPAWYQQLVRGERPDVLIVGANFLREPWYRAWFSPQQIEEYSLKFSGEIPLGPEGFVQQLAEGVIDANLPKRGVFTTTLHDVPTLQALDARYRVVPVMEAPVQGLRTRDEATTVALLRILPREAGK